MKIEEFTVALHCGSDSQVVRNQIESLKELEEDIQYIGIIGLIDILKCMLLF